MPGGTTPRNPPLRFAPARWYFADTPAAHPSLRPGIAGPVASASPWPAAVPAGSTGRSPEPSARDRWAGSERLAVARCGARRQHRPLTGHEARFANRPVMIASPWLALAGPTLEKKRKETPQSVGLRGFLTMLS